MTRSRDFGAVEAMEWLEGQKGYIDDMLTALVDVT